MFVVFICFAAKSLLFISHLIFSKHLKTVKTKTERREEEMFPSTSTILICESFQGFVVVRVENLTLIAHEMKCMLK